MKYYRRAVLGLVAAAAVLGIAAAIAFHAFSDPERLKSLAREKARQAWSRDLAIGDMSLHLLPLPTLSASDVTLADVPGDKDPWQLHVDRVVIGLEPWPLLIGKARPRDVQLEGDIVRHGRRLHVVAAMVDISSHGQPDAASDGKIDLDFGKTRATVSGRIPLQPQLRGAALTARFDSQGLNDMLGFFGIERPRATAPAHTSFELRDTGERIEVLNVEAALGKLRVTGDARISTSESAPVIDARLKTDRLDWVQALLDWGSEPRDPLPPEEMFYDHPWAWPMLVALQGKRGTIDARLGSLRLRNGVELQDAKVSMAFEGDTLHVRKFTTNLLGGSATGTMQFEGRKKETRIHFEGTGLLLERWFKERQRDIPFTGGPMAVTASIVGTGNSMREIAGSMTGPVSIRMGPGVWALQKAGDAEALMVAFSKKNSTGNIAFECASAELSFLQGRATGDAIVGARSDVSRLLTSGYISLRDETLDLRGSVRPKPGMGVGFAAIDGDIRIAGKIRKMKASLDPAGKPAGVVRAGVAIATLGLSLAGSAAANAAREDSDPCADVFSGGARQSPDAAAVAMRSPASRQ